LHASQHRARAFSGSPYLDDSRWGVDWVRLIDNLQRLGMTRACIADRVHCVKGSIDAYASADLRQRPEHSQGERLIALWIESTSLDREDLPMYRRPLSVAELLRSTR
jgi:hypothetical protein